MIDIYARIIRAAANLPDTPHAPMKRDIQRPSFARKWLSPTKRHMKDPYDL